MAITLNQGSPPAAAQAREAAAKSAFGAGSGFLQRFFNPIKPAEVLFFASQLSLMLEIGTSLNIALKTIRDQTENPAFKELLQAMLQDVEEGRQLSEAMGKHPQVFSNMFTSMVKAGETGGFLQEILDRIVDMQERRQALKTQLRAALTYPAILCIVAVLVIVFILVYVLPKFTAFFAGKESILPLTTRTLMVLSASLKAYWWVYVISTIGLLIGLKLFKESKTGKTLIDRLFVSAPVVSKLSNKINTCQLLRTLGNLMESHVPLLEALEVTRDTIANLFFRNFVDKIVGHVREGGRFSQPFADYPYTLKSVKQMVATGEEAGNLPKVMLRLAAFYDTEVEQELKTFAAMIEPMALIVMGAVIGLIVSSVILPLFKLAHVVQ
jgi:type II secretory pathway component PulF